MEILMALVLDHQLNSKSAYQPSLKPIVIQKFQNYYLAIQSMLLEIHLCGRSYFCWQPGHTHLMDLLQVLLPARNCKYILYTWSAFWTFHWSESPALVLFLCQCLVSMLHQMQIGKCWHYLLWGLIKTFVFSSNWQMLCCK